jgi:hypothetical protein
VKHDAKPFDQPALPATGAAGGDPLPSFIDALNEAAGTSYTHFDEDTGKDEFVESDP